MKERGVRANRERHLRVNEFADRSGYKEATIRKKILKREIGYRKIGRMVCIPESELARLMGDYRPPLLSTGN